MSRHYPGLPHSHYPGLGQIEQAGVAPGPGRPGTSPQVIAEDFYTYLIRFQTLTAGSTDNGFIQIVWLINLCSLFFTSR